MTEEEEIQSEEYSSDDDWMPDKAALAEILANQKKELARLQKMNKKHVVFVDDDIIDEPNQETPTIKPMMIKGKMVNAIAGKNGELQCMEGGKLRKIKNKTLYADFMGETPNENEDKPFNGYDKYRTKKHAKIQNSNDGAYEVPLSNTQTFRQILQNTIIKDAWTESKEMLPKAGEKASMTLRENIKKRNLKFYAEATKNLINHVCLDAGLRNIPSNRDALRAYVANQIKDKNWCRKLKQQFIVDIEDMANPNPNKV